MITVHLTETHRYTLALVDGALTLFVADDESSACIAFDAVQAAKLAEDIALIRALQSPTPQPLPLPPGVWSPAATAIVEQLRQVHLALAELRKHNAAEVTAIYAAEAAQLRSCEPRAMSPLAMTAQVMP